VQSVSEDSILLMLTENQSLKQQLERMHIIIKYYAHYPAVAEYKSFPKHYNKIFFH
ncbi:hypothetical protein ALC60_04654, partial [Trachymyrmex zeteki]